MKTPPIATLALLFAYLFLFLRFDLATGGPGGHTNYILAGAVHPIALVDGEFWRLVSANFVHIGFLHLLVNGYFLWSVGPILEKELGTDRFLVLYFLSGLSGTALASLWLPAGGILAGGSAALFGMLGALCGMGLRAGRTYMDFFGTGMGRSLLFLIGVNLVLGFLVPQISNTAHIGGLLGGFLLAMLGFKLPEGGKGSRRPPILLTAACVLSFLMLLLVAVRPVHRRWFLARSYWFARGEERVGALREALSRRGAPPLSYRALTTLAALNRAEGGGLPPSLGPEFTTVLPYQALSVYGIQVPLFQDFLDGLRQGRTDAPSLLPEDPWAGP